MSGVPWSTVSVQREAGVLLSLPGSPCRSQMGQGTKKDAVASLPSGKLCVSPPSDLEKGPPEGGRLELGPDYQTSSSRICCVALSKSFPSLDLSCHTCSRRTITEVLSTFPRESRHTRGLFGHRKAGEGL